TLRPPRDSGPVAAPKLGRGRLLRGGHLVHDLGVRAWLELAWAKAELVGHRVDVGRRREGLDLAEPAGAVQVVERHLELAEDVHLAQLHELADPPEPELGDELLDRSGHDHRGDLLADLVHAVHLARALVRELLDPALVAEPETEAPILLLQVEARVIEEHVALRAGADPASLLLELAPKIGDREVGDAVLALALDHGSRLGP